MWKSMGFLVRSPRCEKFKTFMNFIEKVAPEPNFGPSGARFGWPIVGWKKSQSPVACPVTEVDGSSRGGNFHGARKGAADRNDAAPRLARDSCRMIWFAPHISESWQPCLIDSSVAWDLTHFLAWQTSFPRSPFFLPFPPLISSHPY